MIWRIKALAFYAAESLNCPWITKIANSRSRIGSIKIHVKSQDKVGFKFGFLIADYHWIQCFQSMEIFFLKFRKSGLSEPVNKYNFAVWHKFFCEPKLLHSPLRWAVKHRPFTRGRVTLLLKPSERHNKRQSLMLECVFFVWTTNWP